MPTLPLYDPSPAARDAWHRVISPGGYEWWSFDAESDDGDVQIVAMLFHGLAFHPGYLRRYTLYRRWPTRLRPPVPADYPAAYFVVYERGRVTAQFMSQASPGAFKADPHRIDVQVGPNHLIRDPADGPLRLHLRGTPWRQTPVGPRLSKDQALSADLSFTPMFDHPPHEQPFLSRQLTGGADHRWMIASPLCRVEGQIHLYAPGHVAVPRLLSFSGRGYHDHNYGTAPVGLGLRRWMRGRVLLDSDAGDDDDRGARVLAFHLAIPHDPTRADELHLLEADARGVRELACAAPTSVPWDERARFGLTYPQELDLRPHMLLRNARVIDTSPFYVRLMYDAELDGGCRARALCDVVSPHRLRWPVLGRLIEMSIDRRTCGGR